MMAVFLRRLVKEVQIPAAVDGYIALIQQISRKDLTSCSMRLNCSSYPTYASTTYSVPWIEAQRRIDIVDGCRLDKTRLIPDHMVLTLLNSSSRAFKWWIHGGSGRNIISFVRDSSAPRAELDKRALG